MISKLNIDQKTIVFLQIKNRFSIPIISVHTLGVKQSVKPLWDDIFTFAIPEDDNQIPAG